MTLRNMLKLMYFPREIANSEGFCPLFGFQTYIKKSVSSSSPSSYNQIFLYSQMRLWRASKAGMQRLWKSPEQTGVTARTASDTRQTAAGLSVAYRLTVKYCRNNVCF